MYDSHGALAMTTEGGSMSQRTKKQHFVPRFYLSHFCDEDGAVWTYAPKSEPRARKPEETAVETNFYSPVMEGGERYDEVEKLLAQIESLAAPLWEELMSGSKISGDARDKIAIFIAAQYLRSPAMLGAGAEMAASMAHRKVQLIASSKERHNKSIDQYEVATGTRISPEDREKMREFIKDTENFKLSVIRSAGLPILGAIEHLATLFTRFTWVVGRSQSQHLITSDCPVAKVSDPRTFHPIYGDGGFMNKTVRVTLPLSPSHILEMSRSGEEPGRVVNMPKNMARNMNAIRASRAERFLYACRRDSGIVKLCDKHVAAETRQKIATSLDTPLIDVKRRLSASP